MSGLFLSDEDVMPAGKKRTTKKQIIHAIQSVARKLGRAPIQAEFVRLSGINLPTIKRYFRWFPAAVRAAGLMQAAQRVKSADILQDWAEVTRRLGHIPSFREYVREGRYCTTVFQRRFGGWAATREAYLRFADSGGLNPEWADVTEMVRRIAIAGETDESRLVYQQAPNGLLPPRQPLPIALAGMKCVTRSVLGPFVAHVTGIQFWSNGALFNRRVLPDRPLLGPPMAMTRTAMSHEPVNEMGVVMLFSMWADRLGFLIEFAQARYPDCKAKMEVEPGRWQDVNVEFEMYSANFKEHQHEARKCDLIICWKHNWPECPEEIMVLELSRVVC